jgi:NAD(P)-dependent dehydrogenase (short-subunit alcohol dehydrogenase family)
MVNDILKNKYKIKCLVNNAAFQLCKPIYETTVEEFDQTYNCNVRAPFILASRLYKILKKNNGSIINIGSVHATCTSKHISVYASSKAALVGLTRNMAIDFGPDIRVNSVSPGAVNTTMLHYGLKRGNSTLADLASKHLLNRVGNTMDIANFVYYLSDDAKSAYTTGSNFIIDGGATCKLSTE